jgi:hypothetical protein
MPFGLSNVPATFQAYINGAIEGLLDRFVVVYLNDILIYSKNLKDYKDYVQQILERLYKHKLYIKLNKYKFSIDRIEFLRFIVRKDSIEADPKRVYSILE